MPSRDPYAVGKLGSYDCSTLPKVDSHLRALRIRLTVGITPRMRIAVWHDLNMILDRRTAMTAEKAGAR